MGRMLRLVQRIGALIVRIRKNKRGVAAGQAAAGFQKYGLMVMRVVM
jgi:hypothetical protein